MSREQVGKFVLLMKCFHHGFLVDSQNSAICHSNCRTHAKRLACKRTFAEKLPVTQYADGRFLASFRNHGEFYLARLDVKHSISDIALREDGVFIREEHGFPALADGC